MSPEASSTGASLWPSPPDEMRRDVLKHDDTARVEKRRGAMRVTGRICNGYNARSQMLGVSRVLLDAVQPSFDADRRCESVRSSRSASSWSVPSAAAEW